MPAVTLIDFCNLDLSFVETFKQSKLLAVILFNVLPFIFIVRVRIPNSLILRVRSVNLWMSHNSIRFWFFGS